MSLVPFLDSSRDVAATIYSIWTTAPSSFKVAMIFSASSFGTESFMTLGALSTNFFESTKLKPSKFLISLMTFGFAAVSNDISFKLKRVFSCAAGAASSSGSAAAGAAAAGAAANPPTGRSGMLSRDYFEVSVPLASFPPTYVTPMQSRLSCAPHLQACDQVCRLQKGQLANLVHNRRDLGVGGCGCSVGRLVPPR